MWVGGGAEGLGWVGCDAIERMAIFSAKIRRVLRLKMLSD